MYVSQPSKPMPLSDMKSLACYGAINWSHILEIFAGEIRVIEDISEFMQWMFSLWQDDISRMLNHIVGKCMRQTVFNKLGYKTKLKWFKPAMKT